MLPSVLVLLAPLALFAGSAIFDFGLHAISLGVLIVISIFALASLVTRRQGKKHEKRLIGVWGELPTTTMLRHSDASINSITKARYHRALLDLDDSVAIPDAEQEAADPANSDKTYSSLIHNLRENTRDAKKFPLVHVENANYGFARNIRGVKAAGLIVGVLVLSVNLIQTFAPLPEIIRQSISAIAGPAAWQIAAWVAVAQISGFAFLVNDSLVKLSGENYARALLASLEDR